MIANKTERNYKTRVAYILLATIKCKKKKNNNDNCVQSCFKHGIIYCETFIIILPRYRLY